MNQALDVQNAMLQLHTKLAEIPDAEYDFYASVYKDQCNNTPLKSWLLCHHRFDPKADYSQAETPIILSDINAGHTCIQVANNLRAQNSIQQLEFNF